jgi:asparagine synthase (glutamine-hydrolysing)
MPFLNPDVAKLDDAIARIHPTLVAPADFPKGKYLQIATSAYLNIDYHLSVQGQREIDRLCPLLAQPFLELCYRLPTWQQIDGGIDRSLARSAFRDLLPDHIVARVSKSVPEGIYDQVFIRNRDMISARLMDGRLVSNAIVNRTYLENALHSADALSVSSLSTILQLYDWEIWADRWSAS